MRTYDLLISLKTTASLKTKESILAAHKDDETLKQYLTLALSPRVLFNVSKTPPYFGGIQSWDSEESVIAALQTIHEYNFRGRVLWDYLLVCATKFTPDAYYVFSRALEKDLDCNVGATIVNKVWPKLIPEHPYMGAKSDTADNRTKLGIEKGAVAQEKCDGMYCDVVIHDDIRTYFTRQGQVINLASLPILHSELKTLPIGVWQGELRVLDTSTSEFLPRHIGNGIIRRGLNGGNIELEPGQEVIFTVWDYLPDEEAWQNGKCALQYHVRFRLLDTFINTGLERTSIRVVRSQKVNSWAEANKFYANILAEGGEGAIVKRLDGTWKDGKPSWQVKMKVEESCDMLVVGVVPHSKEPGYIGALEVTSAAHVDLNKMLAANCGGLMEEAMRHGEDFWVGKVIRMKYNALSPYGRFDHPRVDNGKPPKWDACIRSEGSKPNTAEEIRENYNRAVNPI